MQEYLSPERIANSICQEDFTGYYLIVEGSKDVKLYGKFCNKETIKLKQAFGAPNLLKIHSLLNERGFKRKLGILDRDFLEILSVGDKDFNSEIFYTDYHDIEVMMIMSRAFENVLQVYTSEEKLNDFEKKMGKKLIELLFNISDNIGYLKLVEKKYKFGLKFKPEQIDGNTIKYSDFISDKLEYKGDDFLIRSIINYSRNRTTNKLIEKDIKEKYSLEKKAKYDSKQLSNGHDLSNIILIFFKKTLRSSNRMLIDYNSIEDSLILAYEYEEFRTTQLYEQLTSWSKENRFKMFVDSTNNSA